MEVVIKYLILKAKGKIKVGQRVTEKEEEISMKLMFASNKNYLMILYLDLFDAKSKVKILKNYLGL